MMKAPRQLDPPESSRPLTPHGSSKIARQGGVLHGPCVAASIKQALAALWVAVNDLGIDYEQIYDLGV